MDLNNITKFQALFITYLRLRCEGSWRWVAAKYEERYTEKIPFKMTLTFGGNQIDGMFLCNKAGKILNIECD
jgi:hypothetical protein